MDYAKVISVVAILLLASLLIMCTFAAPRSQNVGDGDVPTAMVQSTKPPTITVPETGGCPFYPQPQKIDLRKTPEFAELFEWMNFYLTSILDANARPSISANMVYLDETLWKGNFGNISKTKNEPPTENTIYRIASISKIFPVLYLFKLWEDGKVNLEDPVTKFAPDFTVQPQMGSTSDINLIDIASQISGLPGSLPFNPLTGSAIVFNGRLEDALELLKTQVLVAEPRTKCIYSNLAYALLGDILARNFSDGDFTGWAQTNIVDALQLSNTGFEYNQDVISKMATGYLPDGRAASIYDMGWYGPTGNYYSTAGKISMSLLETSKSILKHGTLTEMLRQRKHCRHGYMGNISTHTGAPWEMNTIDEYLIVRKDGVLHGYTSTMALVPDLKLAFNVLMSGNGGGNIARKVLQKAIPVFRGALRSMVQKVNPTPDPGKYVGRYSFYNLQTQVIRQGPGGVLLMENPIMPAKYNTTGLSYVDEGLFRMKIFGGEFPCATTLDKHNNAVVHFRELNNGRYDVFDLPERFIFGFERTN